MPLGSWVKMFRRIYFPTLNYGRNNYELFTHLVRAFGGGAKYLFRYRNVNEAKEYLARLFAWYCALAIRLDLNLDNVLWRKFPAVCSRCLRRPCECSDLIAELDTVELEHLAITNQHMRPRSLREWQAMFAEIYQGPLGSIVIRGSREAVAIAYARLAEELGETADAIAGDEVYDAERRATIENEMADVLAWIFSLANLFQGLDPAAGAISLADAVFDRYPERCAACAKAPCQCVRGDYRAELASKGAMSPSQWDDLTEIPNRGALNGYLDRAHQEQFSGDGTQVWSLLFFDLDHFGQVNKQYGHDIGDRVLRHCAASAGEICRTAGGFVFRRGGEEFVAVLRGKTMEQASELAERLRSNLERQPVRFAVAGEEQEIAVTASIGVASTTTDSGDVRLLESIAERRSRIAKSRGRNAVVEAD